MDNLLFYREYEAFYAMARTSAAFAAYCRQAFAKTMARYLFVAHK